MFRSPGAGNDLYDALRDLPPLAQADRRRRFRARARALDETPIFSFARPYTPDLVAFIRSFGQAMAPYDANGHYAARDAGLRRLPLRRRRERRPPTSPRRRPSAASGAPLTFGNLRRCPGAAAPPPADGSAPFVDSGPSANADCDPVPGREADAMSLGRKLLVTVAVGLLVGVLVAAAGGGEDDGTYRVRAVFDNASFVIPGEDVKVAGVKVGTIDDVDVTEENKAAVVLRIDDPAFTPFRNDAHCQIRLQSLIGEQYIECEPTQQRKEGEQVPPELPKIDAGDGEGQYLLPVEHTTTPVGGRPDQQHHAPARSSSGCG